MAELLTRTDIDNALGELTQWREDDNTLVRTVEAPSFPEAIELVRQVAEEAEAAGHHPDIDIRWRKVTFALTTHSEGGLTERDLRLARTIDRLAPT